MIHFAFARQRQPSAVILDGPILQSSGETGPRIGYDSYQRKRDSKVHVAVAALGHLLAVCRASAVD